MVVSPKAMTANSPSVKHVLSSRSTPDGTERYGFYHPSLRKERKEWAKLTFLTFGLITLFMFLFLSIYFGSYYAQIPRATHFTIEVLDLDSAASPTGVDHPAILGPAVRQAILGSETSQPHLGWYEADEGTLQTFRLTSNSRGVDPYEYAVERVNNQDVWGVMIINANATSGVWTAITSGSAWEPTGAITFVYEEARNFYGADQYVTRLTGQLVTQGTSAAATTLAGQVLALGNASAVLAAAPMGTITGAFSYNQHNLHPFDQTAGIAGTTVGTVYLIIFTFLISVTWNTQGLPLIQDKLALGSEVLVKLLVPFIAYFWLSLHYSLVSLAFLVEFNRKYGRGGFVIYWMANWITMSGLGFVMETVFLWLGPMFPFFLIFWVILNVSPVFLDIGDMATFYRYAYFVPVWNLVDMSKSIIFATKNHLAQNFAVNLGWLAVWMTVLAITVIWQRRTKETTRMKKVWEEMKSKDQDRAVESAEAEKAGPGENRDQIPGA